MREEDWRLPGFNEPAGFGHRAALVVVDTTYGFTDPSSPCGSAVDDVVAAIADLLQAGRRAGLAIFFTTISYDESDARAAARFLAKTPAGRALQRGTRWEQVDERVAPRDGEPVLRKLWPSAFFGTSLATRLTAEGADTLIVAGLSTSGCVRATAVDGMQHGLSVIVAEETVGDRNPSAHRASLLDIDAKYGDVLPLERVVAEIDRLGAAA